MWSDPRVKPPPGVAAWNPDSWAAPGCVGYWAFNEGGGSRVYDYSPGGNHGTMTNMDPQTDWVAGESGAALDFDGANDLVRVPHASSLNVSGANASFSIGCWFKAPAAGASYPALIEKGTGINSRPFQMYIHTRNKYVSIQQTDGVNSGNAHSSSDYLDNKWHHVVGVRDVAASQWRIYVDGVDDTATSANTAFDVDFNDTGAVDIGGGARLGTLWLNGQVALSYIYNRAFSADEVARHHEEPYAAIVQPPRVWYFDTGAVAGRTFGAQFGLTQVTDRVPGVGVITDRIPALTQIVVR